jgi:SagB-type dehydrogenase family enzyme
VSEQRTETDLAELFHENTKIAPYEAWVDGSSLPAPLEPGVVLRRFRLPRVGPSRGLSLEEVIDRRVTCRTFDPAAPLSRADLSRLLAFSCGYTTEFAEAPDLAFHRAVPSAGACYPVEAYPIVLNGADLPAGVYRYAPNDHSLELLRPGRFAGPLPAWTLGQPYVADASAVIALAGFLDRIAPRYGERGYRYALLEAGHTAQNLYLVGAGRGLGVLAIGGFVDAAINRLLGLDEVRQVALYLVALGVPGPEG